MNLKLSVAKTLAPVVALLLVVLFVPQLHAGPPQIGEPSAAAGWWSSLNPTQWKMPSLRWPTSKAKSEKAEPKKEKTPSPLAGVSRQMGRTWDKTKQTLNPKNLLPKSDKPASRTARDEESQGWGGWFAKQEEPQKIETINDFLRQPAPY